MRKIDGKGFNHLGCFDSNCLTCSFELTSSAEDNYLVPIRSPSGSMTKYAHVFGKNPWRIGGLEKSSMVVLWVEGACYNMNGGSPQLGAKAMTRVNFGGAGPGSVQEWAHNMADTKSRENSMRS